MKISYNWLKDYVDVKLKAQDLAHKLTMAGLEVTSLEEKQGDWIFEIEITSNRPDWLSIIGIAREVTAITGKKLKLPRIVRTVKTVGSVNLVNRQNRNNRQNRLNIEIQDKNGCLIYSARLIKDVKISDSPQWLKQRLESVGIRPVNNIVDITNFCLVESGQPLHAFDFDKIKDSAIIIRRAKDKETIKTIDGQARNLSSDILVIADSEKPIAVAGVMGGLDSEVSETTKNILLESAYFDPVLIRRGSRLLGISSESSYRFERNVDKPNVLWASERAVNLIQDLAGGNLIASVIQKSSAKKESQRKINLSASSVENLLGIKISPQKIKKILTDLQFKVSAQKNSFKVVAPSFRQDVRGDVDLIEEVARIYGFENLPLTIPPIKIASIDIGLKNTIQDLARRTFMCCGFSEIISYSLVSKDALKRTNLNYPDITEIKNPLSKEQQILAPSIILGLLSAVKNNLNHSSKDLKLFEVGRNYLSSKESLCLGIVACGEKYDDWSCRDKEKIGFFDLKGIVEAFLEAMGISEAVFIAENPPVFNNGATLKIDGQTIGILGEVADSVLSNWDIKQSGVFMAELNLEKLLPFVKLGKRFKEIVSFPAISRDISLVVKDLVPLGSIFAIARETAGSLLADLKLVELYRGGQIPSGFKGITISLEYQAKERTLTDNEVNLSHEKIRQTFQEKLQAKIR